MNALLMWFLLANVGFAVLWVFYRIFLHRDTLFTGKRFTLLLGLIVAMIYPLLNVSDWIPVYQPVQKLTQNFSVMLPEIIVSTDGAKAYTNFELLTYLYITVITLLFGRVVFQFAKLFLLSKRNQSLVVDGQRIICLPKGSAPFSFFNLIFIQPEDHSDSDLHEILHHERTHVRQAHTFDVLFAEIVCTIFWINPFAWLLKYDLRENLEFLADKDVVHAGFDPKSYQYHLLRLSYQQSPIRMGNNFNVSQLQNRIKMMNKKRTSQVGWSKYLLTLPLFAALLLVSYACKTKTSTDTNVQNKQVAETVDTAIKRDTIAVTPPPPPLKSTIKFTAPKVTSPPPPPPITKTVKFTAPVIIADSVYTKVDQMPEYPGGNAALIQFIKDNLKYPAAAAQAGIEGRVVIRFIVAKTGEVMNIEVLRGLDKECDEEGVRVVKLMPSWKPGMHNGVAVDVYFVLPITYKFKL